MSKTYRKFRLDTINVKIDEEIYKYYNVLDGDSSRHVYIATRKPFTRDYKYITVNGLKVLFWYVNAICIEQSYDKDYWFMEISDAIDNGPDGRPSCTLFKIEDNSRISISLDKDNNITVTIKSNLEV